MLSSINIHVSVTKICRFAAMDCWMSSLDSDSFSTISAPKFRDCIFKLLKAISFQINGPYYSSSNSLLLTCTIRSTPLIIRINLSLQM
jgi:hypothetical protein